MEAEALLAEARERSGLDAFGDPSFREGLERLVEDLARVELSDLGRGVWHGRLTGYLIQRLRVEDWLARHPEVEALPVPAPVFIVGLPRTGTTALSHLLARDPATRSLRVWESAEPVPPPEAATQHTDPRIETATRQLDAIATISPGLAALHEDTPTGPTEHQDLLGMSFRTFHFEGMAWVPRYVAWWLDCDMVPAYRFHRRVLQLLQSRCPPNRWMLKSPPDSFCLDAVLAVYPDARFVMTHRDPARVLASVCSLLRVVQEMTGAPAEPHELGRNEVASWSEAMRRVLAVRDLQPDRFTDVHFDALVADPLATVAGAYDALGLPFDAEAERAIATHARANPKGRHGEHAYRLADYGLDAESVHAAFRFYTERCGVRLESEA